MEDKPAVPPSIEPFALTRENIRSGMFEQMMRETRCTMRRLTDAERNASLLEILARRPAGDVWVFGYGSLIWNPAFHYVEQRLCVLRGYARRFCLWTELGRGSPECPGLVLGLEHGGSCRGVAYRLAEEDVRTELEILWQREMGAGSYVPRWLSVTSRNRDGHQETVPAIAFTINHMHERYAGRLADQQVAESIAQACGPLGSCAEYLFNTAERLDHLGIRDRSLMRLRDLVADRMARCAAETTQAPV